MEGDSDYNGTESKAEWPTRLLDLGRDAKNSRSAIEWLRSGIWMALELIGLFFFLTNCTW